MNDSSCKGRSKRDTEEKEKWPHWANDSPLLSLDTPAAAAAVHWCIWFFFLSQCVLCFVFLLPDERRNVKAGEKNVKTDASLLSCYLRKRQTEREKKSDADAQHHWRNLLCVYLLSVEERREKKKAKSINQSAQHKWSFGLAVHKSLDLLIMLHFPLSFSFSARRVCTLENPQELQVTFSPTELTVQQSERTISCERYNIGEGEWVCVCVCVCVAVDI